MEQSLDGHYDRLVDTDGANLSAAQVLALLETERERAAAAVEPDARLIYGVWGVAWLVGFAALWAATAGAVGWLPESAARLVFWALLGAGAVATSVHLAGRIKGTRGGSNVVLGMYGGAWALGLATAVTIVAAAARAGVDADIVGLLSTAVSGLCIGVLYLAGAAVWRDWVQYGLGGWILLCTGAGALAGLPGIYLVMSLAGGGGFLVAAVFFGLRAARSSGAPSPSDQG